jgi:hypothetical protein
LLGPGAGPDPHPDGGLPPFVSLEEGCGLTAEGKAYCTSTEGLLATPVAPELRWRSLSSGLPENRFFCGLTVEGLAYCGGTENLFGELGNGTGGALPGVSKGLTPVLGQ